MELQKFYRFLSLYVWGGLPPSLQRKSSSLYSKIYNSTLSRFIIKPYSQIQYKHKDKSYLDKFVPASGNLRYQSFQDFFTRKLKYAPELNGDHTWPCEGILCENVPVGIPFRVIITTQMFSFITETIIAFMPRLAEKYQGLSIFLESWFC